MGFNSTAVLVRTVSIVQPTLFRHKNALLSSKQYRTTQLRQTKLNTAMDAPRFLVCVAEIKLDSVVTVMDAWQGVDVANKDPTTSPSSDSVAVAPVMDSRQGVELLANDVNTSPSSSDSVGTVALNVCGTKGCYFT
jgi:hypothetical protein